MMKWRESIEAALRREVQEETGFTVAITRLVGIYSGPYRDPRVSSVQIVYAVAIVDGQGKSSPEGRISWVPKDIMPDGLAFDHTAVMTDYLSGEMRLF
jgi:8-oxo-dGTP diphosphatase